MGAAIDFTDDPEAIKQGIRMLRPRGALVLVARLKGPLPASIGNHMIAKEPRVTGVFGRRMFDTWMLAKEMVSSGKVDVGVVTGGEYPLASFEAAFADAASNSLGRVLLVP